MVNQAPKLSPPRKPSTTITSNDDGMFDLNDIWRAFDLKASQAPSQQRNKIRKQLDETANLQVRRTEGAKEGGWQTLATKKALYNYAAWVDYEFQDAVFSVVFQFISNEHFTLRLDWLEPSCYLY